MATRFAPWQSFRIPAFVLFLTAMMPTLAAASSPIHAWLDGGIGWPLHDDSQDAFAQIHAGIGAAVSSEVVVSFDMRRYELDTGRGSTRSVLAVGPGARRTVGEGSIRPFVQANMFLVSDRDSDDESSYFVSSSAGVALGLLVGGGIALGRAFSAPVGASVLLGPLGDVGLFAGISYHPPADDAETFTMDSGPSSPARIVFGAGGSTTEAFGLEFEPIGFAGQGNAGLLWSVSPSAALSFVGRYYRSKDVVSLSSQLGWPPGSELVRTTSLSIAGMGTRISRDAGSVGAYFDFNLSVTRMAVRTDWPRSTNEVHATHSGFGAGMGGMFRFSPRLEIPVGVRYDHVFLDDDIGLLGFEAGLAIRI